MSSDIILRSEYDKPYRLALWRRCIEIVVKKRLSGPAFYETELLPTIENNLHRIKGDYDRSIPFDHRVGIERRVIKDFLREGDGERKFNPKVIQLFDAYVQIVTPKFVALFSARDDLNKMGEIVGNFLRDPKVEGAKYLLAQARQKLLQFFSYDNVDAIGTYDDTQRYLCLFVGETPDYLFALDFAFVKSDIAPLYDEKLRLYYGFCAPGEDFSPLIMRSYCFKERLAGLLYAKSRVVDLSSPTLNELTFDVFTTDKTFHGGEIAKSPDKTQMAQAVLKARQVVRGVRVSRHLERVQTDSPLYSNLDRRVQQFIFDFL